MFKIRPPKLPQNPPSWQFLANAVKSGMFDDDQVSLTQLPTASLWSFCSLKNSSLVFFSTSVFSFFPPGGGFKSQGLVGQPEWEFISGGVYTWGV